MGQFSTAWPWKGPRWSCRPVASNRHTLSRLPLSFRNGRPREAGRRILPLGCQFKSGRALEPLANVCVRDPARLGERHHDIRIFSRLPQLSRRQDGIGQKTPLILHFCPEFYRVQCAPSEGRPIRGRPRIRPMRPCRALVSRTPLTA